MKKLGKKLQTTVETIESYSCWNCASTCSCTCSCNGGEYAGTSGNNHNTGVANRTQAPTFL